MELKIKVVDRLKDNERFLDFVRSLPTSFDESGTVLHNKRNRIRTIDVQSLGIDGLESVVVKRYRGLLFFQKIDYTFFRKPKCEKAYDNTAELLRRGFDVAGNLAYVEVWKSKLFQYAFYVSEVAQGERLDSLIVRLQEADDQATIRRIIRQYAELVARLHTHGVLYWDMNCGNVMCSPAEDGDKWRLTLIDTNRVRLYPESQELSLKTAMGDLILMNPKMGTVEMFIAEYLKCRGWYSEDEVRRIREVQRQRYEVKKHHLKKFFKRFLKR